MFTGIVEETGVVNAVEEKENLIVLSLSAKKVVKGVHVGDSISVNGVCLTVIKVDGQEVTFDLMKETLTATTFKYVKPGDKVNLERSLKMNSRIGGHFVSGHIDGEGTIDKIVTLPNYVEFRVTATPALTRYIVPKGSVAIDGVSLTVGAVTKKYFSVYLIPHTLTVTTFGGCKPGDKVNIETDILAKYVVHGRLSENNVIN